MFTKIRRPELQNNTLKNTSMINSVFTSVIKVHTKIATTMVRAPARLILRDETQKTEVTYSFKVARFVTIFRVLIAQFKSKSV